MKAPSGPETTAASGVPAGLTALATIDAPTTGCRVVSTTDPVIEPPLLIMICRPVRLSPGCRTMFSCFASTYSAWRAISEIGRFTGRLRTWKVPSAMLVAAGSPLTDISPSIATSG